MANTFMGEEISGLESIFEIETAEEKLNDSLRQAIDANRYLLKKNTYGSESNYEIEKKIFSKNVIESTSKDLENLRQVLELRRNSELFAQEKILEKYMANIQGFITKNVKKINVEKYRQISIKNPQTNEVYFVKKRVDFFKSRNAIEAELFSDFDSYFPDYNEDLNDSDSVKYSEESSFFFTLDDSFEDYENSLNIDEVVTNLSEEHSAGGKLKLNYFDEDGKEKIMYIEDYTKDNSPEIISIKKIIKINYVGDSGIDREIVIMGRLKEKIRKSQKKTMKKFDLRGDLFDDIGVTVLGEYDALYEVKDHIKEISDAEKFDARNVANLPVNYDLESINKIRNKAYDLVGYLKIIKNKMNYYKKEDHSEYLQIKKYYDLIKEEIKPDLKLGFWIKHEIDGVKIETQLRNFEDYSMFENDIYNRDDYEKDRSKNIKEELDKINCYDVFKVIMDVCLENYNKPKNQQIPIL